MDIVMTDFDCESILQMLKETPDAAEAIIDMIADLEEVDERCIKMIREAQQSATAAA